MHMPTCGAPVTSCSRAPSRITPVLSPGRNSTPSTNSCACVSWCVCAEPKRVPSSVQIWLTSSCTVAADAEGRNLACSAVRAFSQPAMHHQHAATAAMHQAASMRPDDAPALCVLRPRAHCRHRAFFAQHRPDFEPHPQRGVARHDRRHHHRRLCTSRSRSLHCHWLDGMRSAAVCPAPWLGDVGIGRIDRSVGPGSPLSRCCHDDAMLHGSSCHLCGSAIGFAWRAARERMGHAWGRWCVRWLAGGACRACRWGLQGMQGDACGMQVGMQTGCACVHGHAGGMHAPCRWHACILLREDPLAAHPLLYQLATGFIIMSIADRFLH
jgi:hypothetical protein